jgi:hypothetical protein
VDGSNDPSGTGAHVYLTSPGRDFGANFSAAKPRSLSIRNLNAVRVKEGYGAVLENAVGVSLLSPNVEFVSETGIEIRGRFSRNNRIEGGLVHDPADACIRVKNGRGTRIAGTSLQAPSRDGGTGLHVAPEASQTRYANLSFAGLETSVVDEGARSIGGGSVVTNAGDPRAGEGSWSGHAALANEHGLVVLNASSPAGVFVPLPAHHERDWLALSGSSE